jgi:hypothetical protein
MGPRGGVEQNIPESGAAARGPFRVPTRDGRLEAMAATIDEHFAAVRAVVEAHFPVQELWFQDGRPIFTITRGPHDKERFLELRQALSRLGLLPLLRRREGETVLLLVPKPPQSSTSWVVPVALFAATLGTTYWAGYQTSLCTPDFMNPWVGGLTFSLSLVGILFCHEMGHKLVSIWRGIDATLPYFIPVPPVLPGLGIGTMGAVIFTRTPSPNRDALIELGASGPIAGFLVALPILVFGIRHSLVISSAALVTRSGCQLVEVPSPLLFTWLENWLLHPAASAVVISHPMAFAGWVGLFVTALNLLPASMLDGGHVTRAMFGPRVHMILSYVAVAVAIAFGYWVMALLVLLLIRRGHPGPLDDISPVTPAHQVIAAALVVILVLSAVPLTVPLMRL